MKYYGYIYVTTNLISKKIYIGQRKGLFNTNYYGSGKYLIRAIKKYGKENFEVKFLEYCYSLNFLNDREKYWIKKLNSIQPNGYNISTGGHNGDNFKNHPDRDKIIKNRTKSLRKWLKTDKAKIIRSNATKEIWKRKDYRELMTKKNKEISNRLDVKEKKSINGRLVHGTYKMRKKKSKDAKNFWLNNKKARKEKSLLSKIMWKNFTLEKCDYCEFKSKSKALIIRYHNDNCKFKKIKNDKIVKIESIEEIPEFVYNIEVEDNHNYFASNILVKNCDDAQNPKKAASEKERKNTIDFWNNTLYSRLNQPDIGVRINIQQRLHDQDLSGHLLSTNADQYELIKIPAQITDKSKPIPQELEKNYINGLFWKSRFSLIILDNYLKTLGSLQYANQLQQETAPEEGNLVKRSWFDIVDPEEVTRDIMLEPVHFFLDTAETEKQTGDFTAIVACFKRNNCLYILDVVRYKKEFHESVKFIKDYVYKMRYSDSSTIKIEPKSSGKSIVSQLKATTMLNVQEIKLLKGRLEDKLTRLHAIQPLLESRRVILIQGAYINLFLDSLCTFPNAQHDDDVDAFMYAVSDQLGKPDFDFIFV